MYVCMYVCMCVCMYPWLVVMVVAVGGGGGGDGGGGDGGAKAFQKHVGAVWGSPPPQSESFRKLLSSAFSLTSPNLAFAALICKSFRQPIARYGISFPNFCSQNWSLDDALYAWVF